MRQMCEELNVEDSDPHNDYGTKNFCIGFEYLIGVVVMIQHCSVECRYSRKRKSGPNRLVWSTDSFDKYRLPLDTGYKGEEPPGT